MGHQLRIADVHLTPSTMKTPNHTDPETKKKEKKNEVDERSKPDGKKTTTQKK